MRTTFTYDHYFVFDELTACLKELAAARPDFVKLTALSKTPEGREIWNVELTDPSTGPCERKSAYYVDGSTHAGEVTGSMSALYFLDYLVTNADEPEVAALLKQYAFYFIPRITADGAECYLTTPLRLRSVNRPYPYEQQLPGLYPADVDGDGKLYSMRVKTPYGVWKKDPDDDRIMIRRRPDETEGEFYNIYQEGLIEGYDGVHFDPAPALWGNDFNRNYPVAWAPESTQLGAGTYPLSNIETKTVADYIIAHKNIASVITFHTHGGMFLYPPGFKPSSKAFAEDMERYREIGRIATEISGYPVVNLYDEYTPVGFDVSSGAMDDWCHYDRGIPAYTIECWDVSARAGIHYVWPLPDKVSEEEQEANARKLLKWSDDNIDGTGFRPWTPFVHPQLGEVEIGGFDYKFMFQNCPPKFLLQECEKHTRFMLRHVKMLPRVQIEEPKVTALGGGFYRVEAVAGNLGYLPTYLTREAIKLGTDSTVSLSISGAEVVEGKPTQDLGHLSGFSGVNALFSDLGGYQTRAYAPLRKKASWIIKGEGPVIISCRSATGGCSEKEITLS